MGFEQSKFGDGSVAGSGNVTLTVSNHYGPRDTGKTVGVIRTEGVMREMTLDIDGEMVGDEAFVLVLPKILAAAIIEDAYVEVTEAFVLGGTSPTILIGTSGSEVTNGLVISEATAEATGIYDITSTLTGTWAAGLTADTEVGLALGGTSPTVTDAGKMRVVIRYATV